MKKIVCIMLGISMILCMGSIASAQSAGLELHGIYGFAFSDDDLELEKGWGGGASLTFCLGDLVKLDLGGDYLRPVVKDPTSEGLPSGDNYVQLIPVTGTIRVGPQIDPVYLYVGGGAGYSFNDMDFEGDIDDFVELEDCITYHGCAGFELSFTPEKQIGLRAEGRYVWLKPDLKWKATGDKEEWKMNHFQARAGLFFYF
jgi:Outer membrane protein beta-barrel domain